MYKIGGTTYSHHLCCYWKWDGWSFFFILKIPKDGLCLISYCHNSIHVAYAREESGWTEGNFVYIYWIRYIVKNFMRCFNSVTLKKNLVNMGNHFYFQKNILACILLYDNFFNSICNICSVWVWSQLLLQIIEVNLEVKKWIDNISRQKMEVAWYEDKS